MPKWVSTNVLLFDVEEEVEFLHPDAEQLGEEKMSELVYYDKQR